ncbi:MAG: nickel/cobalt transporter [Actinomycetes bacterium]
MTRRTARALAVVLGTGTLLLASPGAASAHPLGNFTVNRYSGMVVATDSVTVDHVLDLAEIPTAQRSPSIDQNRDGTLSRAELATWARAQCGEIAGTLRLTVADRRRSLAVARAAASSRAGQADLPILRLDCLLRAGVPPLSSATRVELVDTAADQQVGWREMTARGDGVTLTRSDVPRTSRSKRLTDYPKDLLASPLDVRAARLEVRPGGARLRPAAGVGEPGAASVAGGVTGSFQGLATTYDGNPLVVLTAFLAALALGAGHAVAPGHGKTIMAFYLSGRRHGALRAAATVGATVTATHTAGVLALGVLVSAGTAFVPARVYPWLTVACGLTVLGVGLMLLRDARHGHSHGPEGHSHARDHSHGHSHAPHPTGPGHRSLIAMGVAGGLLPSPSAVLVFLGALSVGHPWFGVLLVIAFGIGMATTLAGVGVLVMRLRDRVERRMARRPAPRAVWALAVLPLATAAAVIVLGALLALKGVGSLHA